MKIKNPFAEDPVPAEFADVDFAKLIHTLGGHNEVSKGLGFADVSARRVYTWTLRQSVPGKYVIPLFALARSRGIAKKIEDLPLVSPFVPVKKSPFAPVKKSPFPPPPPKLKKRQKP